MTIKKFNRQWELYKFYHDLEKKTTYDEVAKEQQKDDEWLDQEVKSMASSFGGTVKLSGESEYVKALRNINYEMEKASQEFSKLFNYDDKSK